MERIRALNRYQKILLLVMAVMILVFGVLYGLASGRTGIRFRDGFLVYSEEQGNAVYSGTIQGQEYRITVTGDKTVTFLCDDRVYGPYTLRKDASAVPADDGVLCEFSINKGSYATAVLREIMKKDVI